jgi:hypothetical protein
MKTIMVRYKTSEARAEENANLVRAVFDQLRERAPEGTRYACYRLADGVTFVHVASHSAPGPNPIPTLPAFEAFQSKLRERCVEPPVATDLDVVDSYEGSS